ncbi:MAG TPA: gamma-glutamyl-gamma-aminobutyrate hydrolase family protein, partial [Limnochordia bacterium]
IDWVSAEDLEGTDPGERLEGVDGVLVPGGFGDRGVMGKINAIRYCREHRIPFLGICLGMHCAVVEFARNVCGLAGAHSSECDPQTPHPVIDLMPEQRDIDGLGGTMRLGLDPCVLQEGSLARAVYGEAIVYERHRHRYEVNNAYRSVLVDHGLLLSGLSPDRRLVEIIELPGHPWFIAGQFHPELRSRPNRPHPLFRGFVRAALDRREERSRQPALLR